MANRSTRSERIEARTTPGVLAVVRQAAEIQGRSLSDFIMAAAEDAAKRAIEDKHMVRLSAEDQKRFVEAILNPPPPTPAMQRAWEHHSRLVEER